MRRRRCLCVALLLAAALGLAGCGGQGETGEVAGSYFYEKEGFGGGFTLTLQEDGTYSYYEGPLSSYRGSGTWTLEGDTLCLSDREVDLVNYFQVEEGDLVFQEASSSNFIYVKMAHGDRFLGRQSQA